MSTSDNNGDAWPIEPDASEIVDRPRSAVVSFLDVVLTSFLKVIGFLCLVILIGALVLWWYGSSHTQSGEVASREIQAFLSSHAASKFAGDVTNGKVALQRGFFKSEGSEWIVFDLPPSDLSVFKKIVTDHWLLERGHTVHDANIANATLDYSPDQPSWWQLSENADVERIQFSFPDSGTSADDWILDIDRTAGRIYFKY